MDSKICNDILRQAVGEGTISKKEADDLLLRMRNLAKQRQEQKGMNAFEALSEVAGDLTGEFKRDIKRKERDALLNLAARINADKLAKGAPLYGDAVIAMEIGSMKRFAGAMDSVDGRARALSRGKFLNALQARLEKAGIWDDMRHQKLEEEIVKAFDGDPKADPRAVEFVKIYDSIREQAVAMANRHGADIGFLPDYRRPQTWDTVRVRDLGYAEDTGFLKRLTSKPDENLAWNRFKALFAGRLDEERTFNGYDGDLYLRKVFNNFWTGNHDVVGELKDLDTMFSHVATTAGAMSQRRLLHFKSAADWWAVHKVIGKNVSMLDAATSQLDRMAHDIALLQAWGPGGQENRNRFIKEAITRVKDDPDIKNRDEQVASLTQPLLDASWNVISGAVNVSSRPTVSKIVNNIKGFTRLATMGGSGLTAFVTDKAFMLRELERLGMPKLDALATLSRYSMPRTAAEKEFARMHLAGIEATIHSIANRFSGEVDVSRAIRKANDFFFNANLLNKVTHDHRFAVGEAVSHWSALNADRAFAELPEDFRVALEASSVNEKLWDIYRRYGVGDTERGKFLTEEGFKNIPDSEIVSYAASKGWKDTAPNRARAKDEIFTNWRMFLENEIRFGVPEAGARERAVMMGPLKPGTFTHAIWDMAMMLKAFPVAIVNSVMARDMYRGGAGNLAKAMFSMNRGYLDIAWTVGYATLLGYASWSIKNALNGKSRPPLYDEEGKFNFDTLFGSMSRGGGLGILGDFMLQEYDSQYRRWTQMVMGPVLGNADFAAAAISKTIRGESAAFEINKLVQQNTPGINLFYLKPIMNHLILWSLDEASSPGIMERRRERYEKSGGRYWEGGFLSPEDRNRYVENMFSR